LKKKGFTLVELMIVVSILGIMGAMAFPNYQDTSSKAKEASAKSTLGVLRSQAGLYKVQHNGLAPGYIGTFTAPNAVFEWQFIGTSAANGSASASKTSTATYPFGPYLSELPQNPFNGKRTIKIVPASVTDFSTAVDANYGWLYQKETCTFKLSQAGTDTDGKSYMTY
jgi:prepilin-type N-terminal cleavage/methylation domain-containing protein